MKTALYTHAACLEHDPGPGHPESPERLKAVLKALAAPEFSDLVRLDAPRADIGQLTRVHDAAYVRSILAAAPSAGRLALDDDTIISPESIEAALRAAGAPCAAVDAVMDGRFRNAFCAVRPPGHHAEPGHAMGFCLFNNIAVGAYHARAAHGLRRVAIVDFDVHHGNGTQTLAERDPDLFYASTHQFPLYPGTGKASERGQGNVVNMTLSPGTGSAGFKEKVQNQLIPALHDFAPDFLMISAGFDAHSADPLAALQLQEDDYAWITRELVAISVFHCGGRLVSTLEGGYELAALASSAAAHVRALMEVV